MATIYVWVRTVRSLQFFLPSCHVDSDEFAVFYDICSKILALEAEKISFHQFHVVCEQKLGENLAEAIFQNAVEEIGNRNENAKSKLLAYSLLFAGLQQRTRDLAKASRAEILLSRLSKYFGPVFKLLFQQKAGKNLQDREIGEAIESGQGYEFLDELFEGTVRYKNGNTNNHGVRPLSHIVSLILDKSSSISLPFLCNEIRRHLIKDPYHIDEFSSEKPIPVFSTARRTTLAHNSRRVVHLHYINKIEVLRKDEFANVHLRICNDKPKASYVFVPLRSETVFLDSLMYCKWIVLGAVRGIVIIRNCQCTRISASCDQIVIMNCRNLEIFSMSPKKPIIHNSQNITFAPLNTIYESQEEFIAQNGHSFESNQVLKEPINFGECSWKLMDTSRFVCQQTPLDTTNHQFERCFTPDLDCAQRLGVRKVTLNFYDRSTGKKAALFGSRLMQPPSENTLVASLPEIYRSAHHRNTLDARKCVANCRIGDVVSHSDILYLKSKIEKRLENDRFSD